MRNYQAARSRSCLNIKRFVLGKCWVSGGPVCGGTAILNIMFAGLIQAGSGLLSGGSIGGDDDGGAAGMELELDQELKTTTVSGGPFTSGAVSVGGGGVDTKTIMVIGAVALVALFLLKR